MKLRCAGALCALLFAVSYGTAEANAQATADSAEAHLALAKAAARQDYTGLFNSLCIQERGTEGQRAAAPRANPPASEWHTEPVKVFDNLYFLGSKPVSAWAVTTSEGIILIDSLHDYMVEDEIVNGMKKLGLDPAKIKYLLITHAHGDHFAGAKYLQEHFGPRVLMSAADWDHMERVRASAKPRRDMAATDGQKLTLGDTTLTLYVTPGHTPGTISSLIPVKDGGKQHLAAMWGGMVYNFPKTPENFKIYSNSAQRFSAIVAKAPVDVVITGHSNQDNTFEKIEALKARKPGGPHPFVVGNDSMKRLLQVVGGCATVKRLQLPAAAKQ
ncbi:MAG: hypothetical protein A3J28_04265 [Acidobacteria bacterium RIFCSPLOWO2_12_FULL_60_22]|nr:MAG: hypothetical protein A3J28_04265 [Acidobacteria bacterium RIFCSPLOWO2_12_FULL_60_22]